ncbi:ABC transporter ATP-binding protein [Antrihabitans spumae]|uniref:ATP-binding cassette domain-containing protein n=1 Tax=Antrihabitans spumae TaxID=3373370 RepID=A0ABW7JXX3_9NOCA
MADAIIVSKLIKNFGSFRALNQLDLTVKTGEVHGFLGPNGSGKSTTIRILLGLMRKSAGEVRMMGGDPWRDAVELHRRLAYVPGEVNLWPNLSGGEAIDILGSLRGGLDKQRRKQLLDRFDLDPSKKFRTYSKGNRQKVALVAALTSDVELYILDEPTSGLDPLMEAVFQECIRELKSAGKTVLLSSHILAEVESLCDRVTIISHGETIESGTLAELQGLHHTTVIVETEQPITGLQKLSGIRNLVIKGRQAHFEVDPPSLDAAFDVLSKLNIRSVTSHPPTLEELFLRYYKVTDIKDQNKKAVR